MSRAEVLGNSDIRDDEGRLQQAPDQRGRNDVKSIAIGTPEVLCIDQGVAAPDNRAERVRQEVKNVLDEALKGGGTDSRIHH